MADVLAGNVSIYFSGIPPAIGHVKAGTLVALGIAGTRPVSSLPTVSVLATGALQRLDLDGVVRLLLRSQGHAERHRRAPERQAAPDNRRTRGGVRVLSASASSRGRMTAAQFEQFVTAERKKYGDFLTELEIRTE